MTATHRRPHYWEQFAAEDAKLRVPPGEALAALRRGIGRDAGSVPQMWHYYSVLRPGGDLTYELKAEHVALTLFGVHQQSQSALVHRPGISFGDALSRLRASGRFSEAALDARVARVATASSLEELAQHARGLINQLKTLSPTPSLDYTRLFKDLRDWQYADRIGRVRRRWGADYFRLQPSDPQK